jgi:1-acyl-sn-glycerol-3-phosphate acyltransferase
MKKAILSFWYLVYGLWTLFNFTWLMLLCVPIVIVCIMVDETIGGRIAFVVLEIWARLFSGLSGIFYKTIGKENIVNTKAAIYVANHGSYLDAPALVVAIPQQCRPLGKKEILSYPVFGIMFRYIGVTVDRSNPKSRKESLEIIKGKLLRGINIMFFPEGTMNKTEDLLIPFKDGAFRLAVETGTPVVPMAIHNSRNLLPRGSWELKSGVITIEYGKPISPEGKDIETVKAEAYQAIYTMLKNRK